MDFVEMWLKRHKLGILRSPAIDCPICCKKTRAKYRCQFCKTEWNNIQLEQRREIRKLIILKKSDDFNLDSETRNNLKMYLM